MSDDDRQPTPAPAADAEVERAFCAGHRAALTYAAEATGVVMTTMGSQERLDYSAFLAASPKAQAVAIDHAWSGDGNRAADGYDGPICTRCGTPDTGSDTPEECKP